MRVLHIVNSLEMGGLEKLVVDMAIMTNSKPNNTEFIILPIENPHSFLQICAEKGNVRIIDIAAGSYISRVKEINAKVKSEKIDILHTHNERPLAHGILASKLYKIPIIHTKHGTYIQNKYDINYWMSRFAYHMCDKIVAVSKDTKKSIISGFNISEERIVVVPNGINTEVFSSRNKTSNPVNKIVTIGCVGRLSPEKGHAVLLEAFAKVIKNNHNVKLLIAGRGTSEEALRAKAQALNILSHVEFLGERIDIPDLMGSFDIYAQTSVTEGMSLTLLEAMATGLPIVATNVGGNPEVIIEDETGILVPPGEADKIADAILRLLTDKELASRMGKAAEKRARDHFSLERMVRGYEALYGECLVGKPR